MTPMPPAPLPHSLTCDNGALSTVTGTGAEPMTLEQMTPGRGVLEHPSTVLEYVTRSRADNTVRAYRADLATFTDWCRHRNRSPLPASPETVAQYITDQAGRLRPSTVARHLAGISVAHQVAGYESPTRTPLVRRVLEGIRRVHGSKPDQHAPAGIGELRRMVARIDPSTLPGARNRALLLVGFALAARRSELVALTVADLEPRPEGFAVHIRRSKTDQTGAGTVRALPRGTDPETCPVAALEHWLTVAGITDGPMFRRIDRWGHLGAESLSPATVALVVKHAAECAGFESARFSGHSLRAGFATTAAARGASDRAISRQTGHAPNSRIIRDYVRHASVFTDNAVTDLGL
jgi:site-specific recombinase XerD